MEIEGLTRVVAATNNTKTSAKVVRYSPASMSSYRHIKCSINSDLNAVIELIEGDAQPGLEVAEKVTIKSCNDDVVERVIRAMARFHFDLFEVENSHTEIDLDMIMRGFNIELSKDDAHIWARQESQDTFTTIAKTYDGGLPCHKSDFGCMIFEKKNGNSVRVKHESLSTIVNIYDLGQIKEMISSQGNIEIIGFYATDGETLH